MEAIHHTKRRPFLRAALLALLGLFAGAASAGGGFQCNDPAEGFESGITAAGWSVETAEPAGPQ